MDPMPFTWALWLCRVVQTSAAVLLVGSAALRLLAFGIGLDPADVGWRRLSRMSSAVLVVTGLWQLGLTTAEMSGQPFFRACSGGAWREVLDETRFGVVWKWRMGLVGVWCVHALVAAALRRCDRRVPPVLVGAGSLCAAAVLGSLVFPGHAQASERHAWLLPVDVAHALAAGAWPGGLLPLALLLRNAQRRPSLVPAAVVVTRRFSSLSVTAVSVMALSGGLNGVGMIGTPSELWTSAYGRLVCCKGILFALMIALGARNRRLAQRQDLPHAEPIVRRLWRNVALEVALAVAVLLATEALGSLAPPPPGDASGKIGQAI